MRGRTCRDRAVRSTTTATSLTRICDAARQRATDLRGDDKAASSPAESTRRSTIASVSHRSPSLSPVGLSLVGIGVRGGRSFHVAAHFVWNNLSRYLRNDDISREQFARDLKSVLFARAYSLQAPLRTSV